MKAEDFKDFCEGGRYGGSQVLVQLKDPRTFTAMLDKKKDLMVSMLQRSARDQILAQAAAQGIELSEEDMRSLPPPEQMETQVVPPVPVLLGTLEVRGELLCLHYMGGDGSKILVTLLPDDIKHLTVAEATRILT